jgi:hypothetical protein
VGTTETKFSKDEFSVNSGLVMTTTMKWSTDKRWKENSRTGKDKVNVDPIFRNPLNVFSIETHFQRLIYTLLHSSSLSSSSAIILTSTPFGHATLYQHLHSVRASAPLPFPLPPLPSSFFFSPSRQPPPHQNQSYPRRRDFTSLKLF